MSDHTPGPWIAVGRCIDQFAPHPEGQRLLSGGNTYSDDDYSLFTEEDCRLIAAAPQMLAALELAEKALSNEWLYQTGQFSRPTANYPPQGSVHGSLGDAMPIIRQAIAAARGQEVR